jgi:hypothetical protein
LRTWVPDFCSQRLLPQGFYAPVYIVDQFDCSGA